MTTKVSFTRGWPQRRIAAFFSMKSPRVSALAGGTSIELARGTWTVHTGLPADVLARSSRWHCYWRRWWQRPRRRAVATVSRLDTLCCVWAPRLPARLLCGPPSLCRRSIPKKFRTNGIFRILTSSRCEWSVGRRHAPLVFPRRRKSTQSRSTCASDPSPKLPQCRPGPPVPWSTCGAGRVGSSRLSPSFSPCDWSSLTVRCSFCSLETTPRGKDWR